MGYHPYCSRFDPEVGLLSLHVLSVSPTSQKHASSQIGNAKLPLGVCSLCPMIEFHPIQGIFLPCIQCSWDRL